MGSKVVKTPPGTATAPSGELLTAIWLFTITALLLLGTYLAWKSYRDYQDTLEQEYRFLEAHARFGDAQMTGALRSVDLLLQNVIEDQQIYPPLPQKVIDKRQLDQLRQFPEVHFLIITDKLGQTVAAQSLEDPESVERVRHFNAAQRPYFTFHRDASPADANRYFLSRPFKTITNRETLAASRAIRGPHGEFLGVALVSMSPAYFESVVRQALPNSPSAAAALLNRDGDVIYRLPGGEAHTGKSAQASQSFQAFLHSPERLTRHLDTSVIDGTRRLAFFSKVGDTPLAVAVSTTLDGVLAAWRHDLMVRMAGFIMATAVSIGVVWDIQRRILERRQARASLQQSDERFRQAMQATSDGLWDWDAVNNTGYFSPGYYRMLGYEPDEFRMSRQAWFDLIHPADLDHARAINEDCISRRCESFEIEYRMKAKDGSWRWVLARGRAVQRDAQGMAMRMIGTHVDITDRVNAQRELELHRRHLEEQVSQRTHELELARNEAILASQAKSTFLANMSHEIRTPMNAIIGLTQLMRKEATSPEQAERLGHIHNAGQHLLSVISDILDLSKIEAGHMQLERLDFNLPHLLGSVEAIVAESARDKGLTLSVDCDGVPPDLCGDPTRLRQALINFAGNAVKFTHAGSIALRARLLRDDDREVLVRFEVQDTGIGIAQDKMPTLFQAFEQADASTTREYGGTGLGLAVARRIALLMGGEVGVDSTPGVGSTFWLTASLAHGQPAHAQPQAPALANVADIRQLEATLTERHRGARILVAEDNPVNREVALAMLKEVEMNVDMAHNGVEAVAAARARPYDLILMDMQMPTMDGLTATRAIRASTGHQHMPIVAMTGNAFGDDQQACLAAGMNDFITKPVDMVKLYTVLLKWLALSAAQTDDRPDATAPDSRRTFV